ncbi:MAG: aspartate aminotransferase family protein [Gracilibacteraceae bacterium]|jgi:predicted acetylornithine/succinylornithine family transaminase|nr:aspartate aminotransferase family protein [Gracilibacteraceae bacterium]
MELAELMETGEQRLMRTYARLPVALCRGEGAWVWDTEGKRYLDFVTGLAVTSLGHAHPEIVRVVREQAGLLLHTSNLYWNEPQTRLAKALTDHSFADKAFFCNSGAEANEGAIKLARKYAKQNYGPHKTKIISLRGSFHGRTLATLTATGQDKYHRDYEPLPAGFAYAERDDAAALEEILDGQTAALFLEPVLGEGGVFPLSREFMLAARNICAKKGILLVFDEVQSGMGRSGYLFAHEAYGVTPDVMTLAKALGNGIPIGAVLARGQAAETFAPGDHASTFGGNLLAAAVANKVVEIMTQADFLPQVREKSAWFAAELGKLARKAGIPGQVRGMGFMLGLPVGESGPRLVEECRRRGLLLNCVGGDTLRFLPPLTVSRAEMETALEILAGVLTGRETAGGE